MSSSHSPIRILALDPGSKEIGFVLLHDDLLVRYGVRNIKKRNGDKGKGYTPVSDLITGYKPHAVILGKLSHPGRKRNPVLQTLSRRIKRYSLNKGIRVHEIEPMAAIKHLVKDGGQSKLKAAALIAARFPELSPYLPRKGRVLWAHKDKYWMNMFDALSLGLHYLDKRKIKPRA